MLAGMRSSGMTCCSSSRSGEVSSSDRGGGSSQPPVSMEIAQCRPACSTVPASERTTCSTRNPDQVCSSCPTASSKRLARAASAAALRAPAEVPTSTSNGHAASGGSQSAIARSTPTW